MGQAPGSEGPAGTEKETKRKGTPGRRQGMKGYGRKVLIPVSGEEVHRPPRCSDCGKALEPGAFVASTALYVLDLVVKLAGLAGLELTHVKPIDGQITCECGHVNCTEPGRCAAEPAWEVALSEWHLVGPALPDGVSIPTPACLTSLDPGVSQRLGRYLECAEIPLASFDEQ